MENSNYFKSLRDINDSLFTEYFDSKQRQKNDIYKIADKNMLIKTGFKQLDDIIGSVSPGELHVIGGRPAMGKTTLMLDIALHIAISYHKPIYIFSLEMDEKQLAKRIISKIAGIKLISLETGMLKNDQKELIEHCFNIMDSIPIYICDKVSDMSKITRITENEIKDGIIFIDYLQLIDVGIDVYSHSNNVKCLNPTFSRQNEIADILKKLADKNNISVVILSQIDRDVEKRENKSPTLNDCRYTERIAKNADTVIFIYRHGYYFPEVDNTEAELIVAKNKQGKTGTAVVGFNELTVSFIE